MYVHVLCVYMHVSVHVCFCICVGAYVYVCPPILIAVKDLSSSLAGRERISMVLRGRGACMGAWG